MEQASAAIHSSSIKLVSLKQLVVMLQSSQEFVLIDCRSFMEFHTSNIQTSINIGGNRLVRRRLLQGKVTAYELLEKKYENKASWPYLQQASVSVVVYDQCADDVINMRPECFAFVIMQQLKAYYTNVYLLKGGFLGFQAVYPSLCWENKGKMEDEDFVVTELSRSEESDTAMVRAAVDQSRRGGTGGVHQGLTRGTGGLTPDLAPRGYPQFPLYPTGVGDPTTDSTSSPLAEHPSTKWHPLSGPALPVTNPGPTEILAHVILGCQADAMSGPVLRAHGITHVINVSVDVPASPHVNKRHFLRIPINDNYSDRMLPHLQRAFDFLNEARDMKGRALVHCSAGISRSPTVAIAYLMKNCHLSMKEGYDYVKSARPSVSPNFNFLGQLIDLERQLQASQHYQHHHNHHSTTTSNASTNPTQHPLLTQPQPAPTRVITGALRSGGANIITTGGGSGKRRDHPLKLLYSFSGNRNSLGGVPLSREDPSLVKQHYQQRQLLPSPSDELRSLADLIVTSATPHRQSRTSQLLGNSRGPLRPPTRSRSPLTNARINATTVAPTPPSLSPSSSVSFGSEDPLSRFPTVSLDQLHFEPCSTARPPSLRGLSATFPRYQPVSGFQGNSLPPPGQQQHKSGATTGLSMTSSINTSSTSSGVHSSSTM